MILSQRPADELREAKDRMRRTRDVVPGKSGWQDLHLQPLGPEPSNLLLKYTLGVIDGTCTR